LIAEKAAKGPSRRFGADPGKVLGDHPSLGPVAVKSGRYGAYVTAGGVNATIPSEFEKDAITLEQAIGLIDERAAKGAGKAKAAKSKGAKSATPDGEVKPAKKTAVKKATAKPKSEATSKARAPVAKAAKTSAAKPAPPASKPAKKSAGKAR
jgi:DNA topoisomerase-1